MAEPVPAKAPSPCAKMPLTLDGECSDGAVRHIHCCQQRAQVIALGGGYWRPRQAEAGDHKVHQFLPFTGARHRPHSVEVFRPDPIGVQIRQSLSPLDHFGFVHSCPSLGFLITPGLPSSGHAAQIMPSGCTTTVIATPSRSPRARHLWLACSTGRASGNRATSSI
jgi:hypothetical protein